MEIKLKIKNKLLKLSRPFRSQRVKSALKLFMLVSYCTLICAAVLTSFRSLFSLFSG
ncbi:MAG: hypothetical protein FWH10_00700 [Oscillospiraceae bacterium]|nr:hypothetical protein [Oscillospiraceae bacterium]